MQANNCPDEKIKDKNNKKRKTPVKDHQLILVWKTCEELSDNNLLII